MRQEKIAPLDGLRGVAILLVVGGHLYTIPLAFHLVQPTFPLDLAGFGFAGVMLFFVLSGFLLFLPYARALLASQPWPSVRAFYVRRMRRILPLYLVVCILILGGLPPQRLHASLGTLLLGPALLYDLRPDAYLFMTTPVAPLWTLTIEWQFYLLLPWLALALAKLAGHRTGHTSIPRLAAGLGGLMFVGLSLRVLVALVHYGWGQEDPFAAPGVLGWLLSLLSGMNGRYLECFAVGMAASLVSVWALDNDRLPGPARQRVSKACCLLAFLGILGCLLWAMHANRIAPEAYTTTRWLFPASLAWYIAGDWVLTLCFAAFLLGVVFSSGSVYRLFSLPPLRYVGKISYSVYLWQWTILLALIPTFTSYPQYVLMSVGIIGAACSLSYYLIERPFLRLRSPRPRAAIEPI